MRWSETVTFCKSISRFFCMRLLRKLISLLFAKLCTRKHFVTFCVLVDVEESLVLSFSFSFSLSISVLAPIFEKICIRRVCKRLLFSNFRKILYLRVPWGKHISCTFLTNGSISRVDMYKENLTCEINPRHTALKSIESQIFGSRRKKLREYMK